MKLAAQAPGVLRQFTNLNVNTIRSLAGETHSGPGERRVKIAVEFVAVPVALTDLCRAVSRKRKACFRKVARIGAEAHRATELIHPFQLAELVYDAVRCCGIHLG